MSEIVPQEKPLEPGALVVGHVCVVAGQTGLQIPPAWKGIVGKAARELFNDGFELDMITAACWMAILRGKPHLAQSIAGDLSLASQGMRMTNREYEQKLALYGAQQQPTMLERWREDNGR